LVFQKALQR